MWVGVECIGKAVRFHVCLECVSRVGLDSVVKAGGEWGVRGLDVVQ